MRIHYEDKYCVYFYLFLTGRVGCTIPFVCNTETGLNDPLAWRAWEVVEIFHSAQCFRQTLVRWSEGRRGTGFWRVR